MPDVRVPVRRAQVLMSIRCRDQHGSVAEEALRRAKFKFPGRQKIIKSNNWWVAYCHGCSIVRKPVYMRPVQGAKPGGAP